MCEGKETPLADPKGASVTSPQGPNSSLFMQFSTKKLQNNRLSHPLWDLVPPASSPAPKENPGSATEYG